MKKNYSRIRFASPLLALALALAGTAFAGNTEPTPVTPAAAEDFISGTFSLDFNTHFISYGGDVWADGDSMSEPTFNPSIELALELPAGFTATLGTWWDVNSKGGGSSSPLGGRIQEVDVWAGLAYTVGDFTAKVTYQAWMYGSDTEDILDLTFSYDTFLSPSLTIHNRLDQGAANGDEGTVLVLGLSHSVEAGPVTISFPFNVAYFCSEDYHNAWFNGGSDDGFGYGSIGVSASVPLSFISEAYGDWSLHANLTYYVTDQDVIPNNPEGDFFTANVGLSIAF
jgi:hypothetical protein